MVKQNPLLVTSGFYGCHGYWWLSEVVMVIGGYQRLCMVIGGYQRLCMVIGGYQRLCMVIGGYQRLCMVIGGYQRLCQPGCACYWYFHMIISGKNV